MVITNLIRALEAVSHELKRQNDREEISAEDTRKYMEVVANAQALQVETLRQQEEWRAEQREHMKTCEHRYHQMADRGAEPIDPVKH